jgi:hypothetical protein
MKHRMAVGSVAAALIVLVVAGCGGSEASPSASAAASETPVATPEPVATEAQTAEPTEAPATSGTVRLTALCAGVGVRKDPAPDGELIVRVAKGATVRVVETVTGDPYEAGTCGESGDDWLKIDRINGKSIEALYGVPYGYAAGGFFE